MDSKRKKSLVGKLRSLPTRGRFSREQEEVLQYIVAWYKEAESAGESLPSFPSIAKLIRKEHGFKVSADCIRERCRK